jgi:cardiolipin synthase
MRFDALLLWLGPLSVVGAIALARMALWARGVFRERPRMDIQNPPRSDDERFPYLLEGLSGSLDTTGTPTGFWVEAEAIFGARLDAIRGAKQLVQLETFHMTPGRRADQFAEALIDRARAGVRVHFLADDFGVKAMPESYWRTLREGGVEVRFYSRLTWRAPLDYMARTHRKLLLVDGKFAYIGGAGISDKWDGHGPHGNGAPWRDFEIRYEGHIVGVLAGIFMQDWSAEGGTLDLDARVFHEARDIEGPQLYVTTGSHTIESSSLKMLFLVSILAGTRRVWIASPFFLPEPGTRAAMVRAAKAGVDVRILTMGPINDHPLAYRASREAYGELLMGGVTVYEYQPAMMHAKALLVDDSWVSAGSTNFDPLSFFHNNELNVSHNTVAMRAELEAFFEESFKRSDPMTLDEWHARPWGDRLVGRTMMLFRSMF